MAEIRANWCQNGDKQKGVKIKRDVKLYLTKSYVTEAFLCHSMFNPLTAYSANQFKIPTFDTLIMRYCVIR
jgi:hypothetical protein